METRGTKQIGAGDACDVNAIIQSFTQAMEKLTKNQHAVASDRFRAPKFDGNGDVELFIKHFIDVARINQWSEEATSLHLRESLVGPAKECCRYDNVDENIDNLRVKYGMSRREARTQLSQLRKEKNTTLQEHATQIERWTSIAFDELPAATQQEMSIEYFCSSLGNETLQQHLLTANTNTLDAAVKSGNEFLQISRSAVHRNRIAQMESLESHDNQGQIQVVNTPTQDNTMTELLKAIKELSYKLHAYPKSNNQQQKRNEPTNKSRKTIICWNCNKEGHFQSQCSEPPKQGNENSPRN